MGAQLSTIVGSVRDAMLTCAIFFRSSKSSHGAFSYAAATSDGITLKTLSRSRIFTSNHLWLSPCRSRALSMKMATRLPAATRPKTENAGSCCSSRVRSMFVRKPCKCSNKVKISLDWRVCVRADRVTLM